MGSKVNQMDRSSGVSDEEWRASEGPPVDLRSLTWEFWVQKRGVTVYCSCDFYETVIQIGGRFFHQYKYPLTGGTELLP